MNCEGLGKVWARAWGLSGARDRKGVRCGTAWAKD